MKSGKVLVLGGGVGGIQTSLDLASSGFYVYLVEKSPSIGGVMAQLDKTFPTNDCSTCILSPKMVEAGRHLNIELITNAEISSLKGEPGNLTAEVKKHPRYIDLERCKGCGDCIEACPVNYAPQIQEKKIYSKDIPQEELEKLKKIFARWTEPGKNIPGREMLIQILQDINTEYNYLPEFALKLINEVMDIPLATIYHVSTFYTAFSLEPRGKHIIKICMGTACHTRGAPKVLDEIERELGIKAGETTKDMLFTIETVNCLGTCALAPVITIDNEYYSVTPAKISKLLKKFY